MRYLLMVMLFVLSAPQAFAEEELIVCRFNGDQQRACVAKAVVVEEAGAPELLDRYFVPAKLFINCGKGFHFRDRDAKGVIHETAPIELTRIFGHDDGVKATLLVIEEEFPASATLQEERLEGYLTLDDGDTEITLRGRCKEIENETR